MNRRVTLVAFVLVILLSGCTRPAVDLKAEGEALMQLSRDWSDVAATNDLDAIMAGWAEGAVVMPPGIPAVAGKPAIRDYVEAAMQMPGFQISWEPLTVHVASSGDMAYMIEQNVITVTDSSGNLVTTYGKGVTVWRKDADGSWKNVIDIWNEIPQPQNK